MWSDSTTCGGRGCGACPLLPAIASGERVAGDALVPPDEHVPVDAAPAEAEARCRGKRVGVVRVHGVAVGRVRIAWSHTRSGEEGRGRSRGSSSSCVQHRGEPAVALRPANFRPLPPAHASGRPRWRGGPAGITCAKCGGPLLPREGGLCAVCHRPFCRRHLGVARAVVRAAKKHEPVRSRVSLPVAPGTYRSRNVHPRFIRPQP